MIGLAVASLAVTSMGATVASSELLVDAVDRLARRRPAPLVLDLGSVGTIPAELPRDAGPPRPPARRPPAADPTPPRPPGPAAPPTADREGGDGGRVVVAHTQVVRRIVIRKPVFLPPPPRPPVPPRPPAHWPRRRWAAHHRHHHHHRQHRRQPCGERRWRWKHDDPPSRALSGQRARGCHPARARHRTRCPRGRA
ncbi:MAG TPA: hypothetical protein VGR74_06005 [Actinomycetota bacterium]|nr:hypothetical protein [Actinomycetota bacterium]